MKMVFITIALDAMPWITHHLPVFNRLPFEWEWYVVEGVAMPVGDTKWVQGIYPRVSGDGTFQYLCGITGKGDGGRVFHRCLPAWPGKTAMFNHVLMDLKEPCIVMQIDADELWTAEQLVKIRTEMHKRALTRMDFRCRYFVGPDIVVTSREGFGNHGEYEWRRVWRWAPDRVFESHEPPVMKWDNRYIMPRDVTEQLGLVFDHYAYALRAQVEFKELYYGYVGAAKQWERLQANQEWPVKSLKAFLPWIENDVAADRLVNLKKV